MQPQFAKALKHGEIIKVQKFATMKGVYVITLVRYENEIYFFKDLNGQLVECCNLNKAEG